MNSNFMFTQPYDPIINKFEKVKFETHLTNYSKWNMKKKVKSIFHD